METMQPVLKNGRNVWDQINMPTTEFHERIRRIKKGMKKEGIDILLLYGNGFNEYGNPCYLSNFIIRMAARGALVVVPKRDEITLIFEGPSRGVQFSKSTTWVEEVRACGDVSKECIKYLKEKNFIPSTVGFVGLRHFMPNYQLQFLVGSLDQCKIVDADHLLKDMRMLKSQRECDEIRRSSNILTHVFDFISNTPFPNMNERMLEAMVYREARLEGGEDIRMLIAKPMEIKWALRPPEDIQISPGNSLIIYLAVEFERYWSEEIRTFLAKGFSLADVKSESVRLLYQRITDGMRPGAKLSQLYKETIREIQKSNVDYIPDYGLGQGIGLSLQESPVITKEDPSLLKEGMCLTLRLAIQDKEMGAIMIGNTIYVSKDGPEAFTK
jgi:Xaa-Pro aminopeptidase